MHHQTPTTSRHQPARQHRDDVAKAQQSLLSFIECLRQLPFRDGVYTLSMDLYAVFEACCGIELPQGFQTEFGRQITKACRDGRLPFSRKTVGRASLAAYAGLDSLLLPASMGLDC